MRGCTQHAASTHACCLTDVGGRWPAAIVLRHRRRPEEASKQYLGEAPYTNRGLRHVGEAPLTNRGSVHVMICEALPPPLPPYPPLPLPPP